MGLLLGIQGALCAHDRLSGSAMSNGLQIFMGEKTMEAAFLRVAMLPFEQREQDGQGEHGEGPRARAGACRKLPVAGFRGLGSGKSVGGADRREAVPDRKRRVVAGQAVGSGRIAIMLNGKLTNVPAVANQHGR